MLGAGWGDTEFNATFSIPIYNLTPGTHLVTFELNVLAEVLMSKTKIAISCLLFVLIAVSLVQISLQVEAQPMSVENGSVRLTFNLSLNGGLAISSIVDKQTGHSYL